MPKTQYIICTSSIYSVKPGLKVLRDTFKRLPLTIRSRISPGAGSQSQGLYIFNGCVSFSHILFYIVHVTLTPCVHRYLSCYIIWLIHFRELKNTFYIGFDDLILVYTDKQQASCCEPGTHKIEIKIQ